MKAITPCLWFDSNAEEAAQFYVSLIKNSRIKSIATYSEEAAAAAGKPGGSIMTVYFELNGQEFLALNGGPQFTFSPAASFMLNCDTQAEIDLLWEKLSEGGAKDVCGWLRDKYGLSWQVVPAVLSEMMRDKDPEKPRRVMHALLKMTKLEIQPLIDAFEGRGEQLRRAA